MNNILVVNNQVAVMRDNMMVLSYVPAAPNGNYGATLTLVTIDPVSIYMTLTSPLPSTIDAAQIVSHGLINNVQASWLYTVPDSIVTAMKAGAGTFYLGSGGDVLGALSGTLPTHVKLVLHNTAGWGVVHDTWAYTLVDVVPVVTLSVTANPTLDPPTAGQPLTGNPPEYTGADNVTWSWRYKTAQDAAGTGSTDIADTGGICPPISGSQDTLFRGAYFTGSGITGDGVGPGLAGPYWSTGQTITAGGGTNVTLATDFIVASNRVALKAVSNGTFTPGNAVSQVGGKTAKIVAYDSITKMLFTGPITGGPFVDNVALTAVGGGAATADGASVPWVISGGEPYYILPPTFNGTPTSNVLIQEIRDDASSPAVAVTLTGQMPKHYGTKQYRETRRVSGPGIATTQDFSTAWLDIGVPLLTALVEGVDFKVNVVADAGGGDRLDDIWTAASLNATATRWTTSSDEQIVANPFPAGHEPTTLGTTPFTDGGTSWVHADCAPAVATSGKDFAVFGPDPADIDRRSQLRYTAQIGGAWTPLSEFTSVPRVTPVTVVGTDFNRWEFRSQEWAEDGEPGGCGMQFIRNIDSDGDYLHCGIDITYPMWSNDFGDNLHSDDCIDLFMHQSCMGTVVDGNFVHQMHSPAYTTGGNHDSKGGIYRKNISANKWTHTKPLSDVPACNQQFMRTNVRWICKVEESGSGPSTRTLYAINAPEHYPLSEAGFTTFQIYKANANGGSSWANDGGAVSVSSTGVPFVLAARSSGGNATGLYLATKSKLMYRDIAPGSAWVGTGLTGEIRALCVRGNAVFALKRGTGLYKATDTGSGPGAFSLFKSYNAEHSEVSLANPNFITIIPKKGLNPQPPAIGTQNGGASWYDVDSVAYPGQPHDFDSHMKGDTVQVHYHKTDPMKVFAFRFQHAGKSVNGGETFNWAGRTFGYSRAHAIGFHPIDFYRMLVTMTDRITVAFEHGYAFGTDDHITGTGTNSDLDKIEANVGAQNAFAGAGALVLARGNHTGYVAQVGDGGGDKTPVIFSRGDSTTTGGTGNSTISIASTPNVPAGKYVFKCTTAGGNGTGKFKVMGPLGADLGELTCGTERVISHASLRGGTITVTISGGSTNVTGQNAKTFTYMIDPLLTESIPPLGQIDNVVSSAMFGQVNPAVSYKGCAGRHRFIMSTAGVVTHDGKLGGTNEFQGYMGPSGDVMLGSSSDTSLTRSVDGGGSFSAWASGLKGLNAVSRARVAYGSHHNDQRAWCGGTDGRVRKVQDGTVSVVFNFADWCVDNGVVSAANPCGWPGDTSAVSGGQTVWMPPVTGVVESWFNPNLVYCSLHLYGAPYQFFRTKNALAATPIWENLTSHLGIGAPASGFKGRTFFGPIYSMQIHRHTDEPIMCSQHGTIVFRPEASHRATYSLPSLVDHLRTLPGAAYYETAIP